MKKVFTFLLLCFTLFIPSRCSSIEILLPNTLRSWISSLNYDSLAVTILPFGHIPWGRKIQAQLVLASPTNACDTITFNDKPKKKFILLAQRDDCDLYVKAQNAEKAGAQMLIITDNTHQGPPKVKLPPSSIGPIGIPTVMITKSVGDKLLQGLNIEDEEFSNVVVAIDFSMGKIKSTSYSLGTYSIGISSGNRESYRFLKEWEPYYKLLKWNVTMGVTYLNSLPLDNDKKECRCSYCPPPDYKDSPASGHDLIEEDLRQICILYENTRSGGTYNSPTSGISFFDPRNETKWWKYVSAYGENCFDDPNVEECSLKIMQSLDIDSEKVNACVKESWNQCSNHILDGGKFEDWYHQYEASVRINNDKYFKSVPSVKIGESVVHNVRPAIGVFEAVCESTETTPFKCAGVFDTTTVNPNLSKINLPAEFYSITDAPGTHKPGSESPSETKSESKPETENVSDSQSHVLVFLIMFIFVVSGLFFWRRHLKRRSYQTFDENTSPSEDV